MTDTTSSTRVEDLGVSGPGLVVITGMAGAGKTQALHMFEDVGYFCIDNLPPSLLFNLVSLAGLPTGTSRKLAVVCDLRSREFFVDLEKELEQLTERDVSFSLLFLDATDSALLTRYKETRRRHPLCEGDMTLTEGINLERETLSGVKEMANYVIDTTNRDTRTLRTEIRAFYDQHTDAQGLRVSVFSFGFKHGFPSDADTLIDVRFLPNPFYEEELRHLTGLEAPVRSFVLENEQTQGFLTRWKALLETIMPGYAHEGKRYLTIGIGCTGGQHRSVVLAEQTAQFIRDLGYNVKVNHRDILLASRLSDTASYSATLPDAAPPRQAPVPGPASPTHAAQDSQDPQTMDATA
ncbi:MAG: RNase adapter RapZ [Coriobacteriales bacterium]|jgi:UPF0042 nucleotide-binding protein|nr:RNase adapter RapZ [Coriobacteriales bacterium]